MAPKAIGKAGDLPVAKCSRTKGNCQMRSQNTSQRESRRERMSEERRPGAGSFSPEPLGESAFNRLPLGEKRGVRGCWLCLEGGGRLHRPEASAQRDRRWEGSALSQGRQGFFGKFLAQSRRDFGGWIGEDEIRGIRALMRLRRRGVYALGRWKRKVIEQRICLMREYGTGLPGRDGGGTFRPGLRSRHWFLWSLGPHSAWEDPAVWNGRGANWL